MKSPAALGGAFLSDEQQGSAVLAIFQHQINYAKRLGFLGRRKLVAAGCLRSSGRLCWLFFAPPCLVVPDGEKRAVTLGRRKPNADYRKREYLTETEIEKLIEGGQDQPLRSPDSTMILVAYRHGLRASEICELRWDDIDPRAAAMHVKRLKERRIYDASDYR